MNLYFIYISVKYYYAFYALKYYMHAEWKSYYSKSDEEKELKI